MISPNYISYKDFDARVILKDGIYYRYILKKYKLEYDHFINSGLYDELVKKELIVSHEEIQITDHEISEGVYKFLRPFQIPFQSYPFEWSYSQWKKSLIAYIEINKIALKFGMILKDATPYNFVLYGGNSIMIDTSSFSFFEKGDKFKAYYQFCCQFFSPFVLMHYNGQKWSKLTRTSINGFSLDFISKQLPFKSWFNLNILINIHFHSKFIRNNNISLENRNGFDKEKIELIFGMILKMLLKWKQPKQLEYNWNNYYSSDIYSEAYIINKEKIVEKWIAKCLPKSVIDIGANTGKFSHIASKYVNKVIAVESNDYCVDLIESQIKIDKSTNLFTLVQDLTETTPNMGVNLKEIKSFISRSKSEMLIALAIEHHFYLSKKLSFSQISEMYSILTTRYLITEYIPITDNNFVKLYNESCKNIIDYTFDNYVNALKLYFNVIEICALKESDRILLFLEKK